MTISQIQDKITNIAEQNDFSGSILIKNRNETIYSNAFGYSAMSTLTKSTLSTRFSNASVTKMFTAAAILQLVEADKISLASKAVEILRLNDSGISPDVTVEHLLTHTSGIADYFEESENETDGYEQLWQKLPNYSITSLDEMLPLFVHKTSTYHAGEKFSYNNAGYILLGLIIEEITGDTYFNYIRKHIFQKAAMADSDFLPFDGVDANTAEGYIPISDESAKIINWKKNIYSIPANGASDGGAFCTAEDLIRFMRAIRQSELFSERLTTKMLAPICDVSANQKYGYGLWFVLNNGLTYKYGGVGEDPGASARIFHYPQSDIDVAVLGNKSGCSGRVIQRIDEVLHEFNVGS